MKGFERLRRAVWDAYLPLWKGMGASMVLLAVLFPVSSVLPEPYPDFIIDILARHAEASKTWEIRGVWFALLAGGFVLWRAWKRQAFDEEAEAEAPPAGSLVRMGWIFLGMPVLMVSFVRGPANFMFFYAIFLCGGLWFCVRDERVEMTERLAGKIVLLLISAYYCMLAAAATAARFYDLRGFTAQTAAGGALALAAAALFFGRRRGERAIDRAILLLQAVMPFHLAVFLVDRYRFGQTDIVLPWTAAYRWFYIFLMTALTAWGLLAGWRRLRTRTVMAPSALVLPSAALSVFVLHAYRSPAYLWTVNNPKDFWHMGDFMLAWYHGIERGLTLYTDFVPNSGAFGMVSSFLQFVFLPQGVLSFNASLSMTYTLFALVTGGLLWAHFGGIWTFLLGVLFVMPGYNRILLVLPGVLLLLLPGLRRHPVYWLCVWAFTGIVSFFYYPLNGAALAAGTIPLGMYQIKRLFCADGRADFDGTWRRLFAGLSVSLTAAFAVWMFPYILRCLSYMMDMSGQTVWADGIKAFPRQTPGFFFPWLGQGVFVKWLYAVFEFSIPIFAALLPFACLLYSVRDKEGGALMERSPAVWAAAALGVLVVNYQYTFMRMDYGNFLARTNSAVYVAVMGILPGMFLSARGWRQKRGHIFFLSLLLGLGVVLAGSYFGRETEFVRHRYDVPGNFVRVSEAEEPRLGNGFMHRDTLRAVQTARKDWDGLLPERAPMLANPQMQYVILDRPMAMPRNKVARSYRALEANLRYFDEHPPEASAMYDTFYFSRWFLQHRYVLYRGKGGNYMVAPARYAAVVGDAETGRQAMLDMPANTFLGGLSGVAASWGTSLSSLEKRMDRRGGFRPEEAGLRWQDGEALEGAVRFPKGKGSVEVVFPEAVFGEESEMLYLDLSPVLWRGTMPLHRYVRGRITDFTGGITKWNGKVRVYWKTDTKDFSKDRFAACDYINGKLLLPMGQIPGWRFENIRGLRIVLDGMPASLFLRLREVRFYRVKEA